MTGHSYIHIFLNVPLTQSSVFDMAYYSRSENLLFFFFFLHKDKMCEFSEIRQLLTDKAHNSVWACTAKILYT